MVARRVNAHIYQSQGVTDLYQYGSVSIWIPEKVLLDEGRSTMALLNAHITSLHRDQGNANLSHTWGECNL